MRIQPLINVPNGIPPKERKYPDEIIWNKNNSVDTFKRRKPSFGRSLDELPKGIINKIPENLLAKLAKDARAYIRRIVTRSNNEVFNKIIGEEACSHQIKTAWLKI